MSEKALRPNYLITILKFILFLFILFFATSFTKEFLNQIKLDVSINKYILLFSILACFVFYTFFVSLNNLYARVQKFFFHSSIFVFLVPSFFIILSLSFFLIPRLFNIKFDRDIFLFLGGFVLTSHLVFVAENLKGTNLFSFVNYLFVFSLLYILNLFLFCIYLSIAFRIDIVKIIVSGTKEAIFLIRDFFVQITS